MWGTRTCKLACAGVALATYFALAEWSACSYVDPTPKGRVVFRIHGPFEKLSGSEYLVVAYAGPTAQFLEVWDGLADSLADNNRSPILIYENARLLGPAHSLHADIANLGYGRYSHWKGQEFRFSTSDNSDPNKNGRYYWVVVP
jgi:hypothetical protein